MGGFGMFIFFLAFKIVLFFLNGTGLGMMVLECFKCGLVEDGICGFVFGMLGVDIGNFPWHCFFFWILDGFGREFLE